MNLADLFPKSPQNCMFRIAETLAGKNAEEVKIVEAALREHAFNNSPITISLGYMKESNGRETWMAIIRRGDEYMEDGHSHIKGRAEYQVARWKHVLLGHDKPNILAYDVNPKKKPDPLYDLTDEMVITALLLVGDTDVSDETIASWSDEQKGIAYLWAMAAHYRASDNNVKVPTRPDFIPHSPSLYADFDKGSHT